MHYGIEVVTLGEYADPRVVVRLAQAAERAGWEGLFVWEHLGFVWGAPSGDPWVILAAVAQATERVKIGTAVTPLPRRRPHVLANTLATLDLLSGGRVILGVGLGGVPQEFAAFGEPDDAKQRAVMLDEGLEVLSRLWLGESVTHRGPHYTVNGVALAPLPVQRPRIPIWVGGESRPALRRAARWDGWIIGGVDEHCEMTITPEQMAEKIAYIHQHRTGPAPFDVAITGCSTAGDGSLARAFADAGVTWWLESLHGYRGSVDEMMARVEAGPPN
jgi:probable F420-dependent oxidoreductase